VAALGDGGVINACASKSGGALRAVDSVTGCKANETALTWNQQGHRGRLVNRGRLARKARQAPLVRLTD